MPHSGISTPQLYWLIFLLTLAAAGGIAYWVKKNQVTPEQREQARREYLNRVGRIIDGTVIDVTELAEAERGELQLLIYSYDVAGVSYEASQDVTQLRQFVDLHTCRIGLPASVKYDPQNPGNSIVVSEGWSGLRHSTIKMRALDSAGQSIPG